MSQTFKHKDAVPYKVVLFCALFLLTCCSNSSLWASTDYSMKDFQNMPINIVTEGVTPKVMIATSNDHQLFYAAYNDYTDLDDDGSPDTTYKHAIDYYGYFDSYKCYEYDDSLERFQPKEITTDKYCNAGSNSDQWSGNFLNWVSMSRIDTIRKILFGGHRRTDTETSTILERSFLPHDAHSWAKYYSGEDLPELTPFTRNDYDCDEDNLASDCGGDKSKMGVTFCNTTDVNMNDSDHTGKYSEVYEASPLIKAVKGNYSLWASNERWQCTWASDGPVSSENHSATNANDSSESGIYAASSSPAFSDSLGEGNYVARIEACVDGLIGDENCKLYPGGDAVDDSDDVYKPIGILQSYGDDDEMEFGMVAGSYADHASGGGLIANIGPLSEEVNVDTYGTFSKVATFAQDNGVDNNDATGIINAWSLFRLTGYNGTVGYYNDAAGDNCKYQETEFDLLTGTDHCQNWVNPFSEIYYQAVNYFAGNGLISDYYENTQDDGTKIPGLTFLTDPDDYEDPLDDDNYCANLYIINLNTSTTSFDSDDLDDTAYQPSTIWSSADLPSDGSTVGMTDDVGDAEGITGNSYFVGESSINSGEDGLCTAKTVTSFGSVAGMCPEEPRLQGSYRIAGLAYYAHTKDIRPEDGGSRALEGTQVIDTYSVALAAGNPVIEIPDPEDPTGDSLVTILPACRNQKNDPNGNCALVNFKIVSQEVSKTNNTASGKFYVNWEDGEMGGDHDQDMWGTLDYELSADRTLTITTQVHRESTSGKMGFGYVISGTTNNEDGFHAHSGIEGFKWTEDIAVNTGSPDCSDDNGCYPTDAASSKNYSLGNSDASLLEDPLWYAAKYGGFSDADDNNRPDDQDEWDSEVNSTGESGSDGIPDNYFYATDPEELEAALTRVLDAILNRTSSGTSAAVVSSNVDGEGAVYSAYYEPSRTSADDSSIEATWMGTLTALWLDSYGYSRQDCTPPDNDAIADDGSCEELTECVPNGQLDNYCVDQVVASYYDEGDSATYMHIYQSSSPESFSSYSMQGVVTAYDAGFVTMAPNSMEGTTDYTDTTLTITPYELYGTVTSFDSTTGEVTMTVADDSWSGPTAETFSLWTVTSDSSGIVGYSTSSITMSSGTVYFTLSSSDSWLSTGDTLTLQTKNMVGDSGETFEDWTIICLAGTDATGSVSSGSEELSNDETTATEISTSEGDFSDCTRAIFYTYDMTGTEGAEYSSWEVSNFDNDETDGTSSSTIALANNGTITFTVSPTEDWITTGDRVQVASYSSSSVNLDDVSYLWNAREELYLSDLSDAEIAVNRDYTSETADSGRFITTWVDDDLDSIVDEDEYREFEAAMFSHSTYPVSFTFLDVADKSTAEELVEYIRGVEKDDSRNRTIKYSTNDSSENVMRLGDIVNSTPTTVSYPQDSYDLLYEDSSYSTFKQQYIDRRVVVYVGANDGMLHAFNGGFYNEITDDDGEETVEYTTSGTKHDGSDALAHPLGSELWAYAPMNLLSHLQWLKDANYDETHISFMDSKPKIFDAKIFDEDTDHPNGWGTLLVAGMNLGGGAMTIDVDHDNDASTELQEYVARSAYIIMDITNPEIEPVLLGELKPPVESFTTVYPAVAAFKDTGDTTSCGDDDESCNSWYLIFGNGPDNITTVESGQTANLYLFDLKQLVSGTPSPTGDMTQDNCEINSLTDEYNIISCNTEIDDSYVGTPVVVDWDLDFKADSLYFGLVRDADSTDFDADTDNDSGRILRLGFNNKADYDSWDSLVTFFNADRPISIYPMALPSLDDIDNHWIFVGSGRYLATADKTSTETQSIFGVKDYEDGAYPILNSDLLDVSDAAVYTDGTLQAEIPAMDGSDLTTFDEIEEEIDSDNAAGWYLDLPPISGEDGFVPSTRNLTRSTLYSSVLLSTVFQPSEDPCEGEGASRLYGLYYKTGTGYPDSPILGTSTEVVDGEVKYLTTTYIELGTGNASAPTITTGAGTDKITAYTQVSTGVTVQTEVEAITEPRSGRSSWVDQDL
ncbi:MAG: Tfp pilus tip-associated adhesin PilY1 [Desulforhopalus sp.]|jgi:Tfp pilus tip-associated adhesin PilY1